MASFLIAIAFAVIALWLTFFKSADWEKQKKIIDRLKSNEDVDADVSNGAGSGVFSGLISSGFVGDDYQEIYEALRLTGKETETIQLIYLLACWALPLLLVVAGAVAFGPMGCLIFGAGGFVLSRRFIRSMGKKACYQQNLEAIELAQMLGMLLGSGLSIERGFRIAALQARPLIPGLVPRLERFNRLMESGADRSVALDDIGEGREIPVLHNLTRLLKQSGALGGAISESINQLVEEALDIEKSRVKEEVNKIGAKMTVVMMVFMLPALFIIVGGPAVMNIAEAISR